MCGNDKKIKELMNSSDKNCILKRNDSYIKKNIIYLISVTIAK